MMLAKFVSQRHALGIASINAQRIAQVAGVRRHSHQPPSRRSLDGIPRLDEFVGSRQNGGAAAISPEDCVPAAHYLPAETYSGAGKKVYIETYGCQMNTNDTEIVWAVLRSAGYSKTDDVSGADAVLVMTCAIREGAEAKIWNRLDEFRAMKRARRRKDKAQAQGPLAVGVLGCMAERLKTKLLESDKMVDLVAGPDAYRDLPRLMGLVAHGQQAANVQLSLEETYADITPVRLDENSVSAYVSIMRGCDNMCSYCIVPFTRGRERSRPVGSILDEVRQLSEQGIREVIVLGQNVNSYRDVNAPTSYYPPSSPTSLAKGFTTIYRTKTGGARFVDLLDQISRAAPEMRVRFTSPHPKDFPDELLDLIAERANICKQLHLPAQSGSNAVLQRMRRGYTREAYLDLVATVRAKIPGVRLSSDFITGFCGETDAEHADTVDLMRRVQYDMAFMFAYSMREKTHAHRRYVDDVPEEVKKARLEEIIGVFRAGAANRNAQLVGTTQLVLLEGAGRRGGEQLVGRTDGNTRVVTTNRDEGGAPLGPGDFVAVRITDANAQTLRGVPLYRTNIADYAAAQSQEQGQNVQHAWAL